MEKWRVLITDGLQDIGKQYLENVAQADDRKGISADELISQIEKYDAAIVRGRTKMTKQVLQKANNLKVIGRCGVGVDNIDLETTKAMGITVVNAPSATTNAVAELTMGLIFSMMREIPRADAGMKQAEWLKKELIGVELYGRNLGILGYGRIGSTVGQMAAAVGMRVIACSLFSIPETIRIIGGEFLMMDDVIEKSDIITIHTPLTEKTRHLINEETIARMKDGVYIVCAARGGIIDEDALLKALNDGKVAGAALDVFEEEPPNNSPLVNHPKVIATPHIGGQTKAAQRRASIDIAREVIAALQGEKLHWKIV